MKTIIITEKPSVAQDYRKVLKVQSQERNDGYIEGYSPVLQKEIIITWAVGHLVAISAPEVQNPEWGGKWSKDHLPMIPQPFKYEPNAGTKKQFNIVKSLYLRKDIGEIYYAGDSGREGIYIQALIRNQIFTTPPKITERVVWIDSFTEESILEGIRSAKPYSTYQPMIDSGYARAMSDWLIGMNFTEGFTLTCNKLINTGRVVTPTLAMIVNRQKEIDEFVKTYFYGVKTNETINWKAVEGSRFFESDLLYNENGFLKVEDANALCDEFNSDKTLTVEDVKTQKKTEYAPYLFNLADLQAQCSKTFKFSPAKTLSVAQSLYEKKYTTYPRTDARFLSTAMQKELKDKFGYDVPDRYVDDSKIEDHFAIIPTFAKGLEPISGDDLDVYNVILKRFQDILKPPFIYNAISVTYLHSNGERLFEAFRKVIQKGFKETFDEKEAQDIIEKDAPQKGAKITVDKFELRNMETNPPTAFTTGSLILAMEKAGKLIEDEELREQIKTCGIGTSATRADIIKKLEDKEFITVDKKQKIAPTEFGKSVIPIIAKFDETLVSPIKTADMEAHLKAIATSELPLDEYMKNIVEYVKTTTARILNDNTQSLANFNNPSGKVFDCPICGKKLLYSKYGWYCGDKHFTFNIDTCGHKMKESDLEDLLKKGKTKVYSMKNKAGKPFRAAIVIDKSSQYGTGMEFDNSEPKPSKTSKGKGSTAKSNGWGSSSSSSGTKSGSSSSGWGGKSTGSSSNSKPSTTNKGGGWSSSK